jgi:hypothetical protein
MIVFVAAGETPGRGDQGEAVTIDITLYLFV